MIDEVLERIQASLGEGARRDRAISALLGPPTWAVLGIALWLEPDARGFGTHQQMGFGTCTFMKLTGYPCPMCGMTTCFTHMAHAEPLQALVTQPFGVVLFSITLAVAILAAVELVAPRGRWIRAWGWIGPREHWVAGALLGGLALGWAYTLITLGGGLA